MVCMQLAIQFVFIILTILRALRRIEFTFSDSDTRPQNVYQRGVLRHANRSEADVFILDECENIGRHGSCIITLGLFCDFSNELVSHIVIDTIVLIIAFLFTENCTKAHVVSWEVHLIANLHLLVYQSAYVFLSCIHLWCHLLFLNLHDFGVKKALSVFEVRHVIRKVDIAVDILAG